MLSDTGMKYGAPKSEMFAVVMFVEKYPAYLGTAPFKLRVDNRALSWLKTRPRDQSYFARWIVRVNGYQITSELSVPEKHQNTAGLSRMRSQNFLNDWRKNTPTKQKTRGLVFRQRDLRSTTADTVR